MKKSKAEGRKILWYLQSYIQTSFTVDWTIKPFKPNIHIQFLQTDLYILLKNVLREYDKRSRYLLIVDHFTNSHNLISGQSMDIVKRKLMLVTIGT